MVNHHAVLPSKDGGSARHVNLSERLAERGWSSSLIVASTRHSNGSQALRGPALSKVTVEQGVRALWVRTNSYGTSRLLRLLGMFVFALNLLRPGITRSLRKPDVILGSTVHPVAAWAAYRLSRRHCVPFVYEIRDIWPESLYGMANIGPRHPISRVLTGIDRSLIRRASLVVSPLPYVDRHLAEMGFADTPFLWVANGFELPDEVDELPRRDGRPFTFMYLGAHGHANVLEDVVTAFDQACSEASDLELRLRLVGDGPLKTELRKMAATLPSSDRIFFEERIPKNEVLARAREADCLIATLRDLPVYRFGVSLNKYFMYLAAGRPVLSGSSAPNNPIRDADAGLVVPAGAPEALRKAMIEFGRMPFETRVGFAERGRRELEENYTFDALAQRLAAGLEQVVASPD